MADTVSTQKETLIVNAYSGDYRIDVLLPSATARWNNGKAVGTAAEVTFSFMANAPTYSQDSDKKGFSSFTEEQKTATRAILDLISQQIGITFKEVTDTDTSYGTMRFGNNAQGATSAGYATYPDTTDLNASGDVYINNQDASNLTNVVPGTNSWATLVHEIGHAIGLKHPGNYNAGEPASTTPDNFLAAAEDSEANTIMSYIKAPQQQERDFFAKYDLMALKYLYGGKAYNADNTTYRYTDADGKILKLINDTGGTDTIDASAVTTSVNISLVAGSSSSVGKIADGSAAVNNLSIAYDAVIENLIGTKFSDTLTGNAANNRIVSGGGSDTVDGGAGFDTLVVSGAKASFAIQKTGDVVSAKNAGSGDNLAITNVERIQFSDSVVGFDINGNAGQTYRLYQAAFDRKPDLGGLGYWISEMDKGASLQKVAIGFTQSAEFQTLYGVNPSNATLLTNIYKNVLHREADPGGYDYWFKELSSGRISAADTLASFADSPENQAQVIGAIQNGIEFTPWLG